MTKVQAIKYYKATTYQAKVTPTQTLDIRAEQLNPKLDQLLDKQETWGYITAWNPDSQKTDPATNKLHNELLETELQEKQIPYYYGAGVPDRGDWEREISFLVLGISKADAMALGKRYRQRAIVWGRVGEVSELIFCLEG